MAMLFFFLYALFATVVVAEESPGVMDTSSIVCTCRCCYQGGCRPMPNVSWVVSSCEQCSTAVCNAHIRSEEVRRETARLFEGIESDEAFPSVAGHLDECKVISVLEAATCSSRNCKRTTTIKAECYNRDAPLIKCSIISFVGVTAVAIVFGLVKNHIPALQGLNEKHFNY
ncbi:endochitinase [Trypanosoma rangeli]|uniref:Endochitinase n=1 Tax=Trypanosoma rangeli TaxID=5698 RepID=A0A422MXC2_TRYRA|nr:endochitinase [Trypanosoma rangeli]RNE97875.1 endochitinase [Trypanosoma rangeli]|eukprot:RNE97875.1 endochitinase [Trypanosoma rangeli]